MTAAYGREPAENPHFPGSISSFGRSFYMPMIDEKQQEVKHSWDPME